MKFIEWFNHRLIVNRYPLPGEILKSNFNYIINVSDEYISYCHNAAIQANIKYFWFPLNECSGDMGLNSLYAALQILYIAEKEQAHVLLHCHAGINRSQMVRDAYYFMRTNKHYITSENTEAENLMFEIANNGKKQKNNRLLENIEQGHLPSIRQMESFLGQSQNCFNKEETRKGGSIDYCKIKSKI